MLSSLLNPSLTPTIVKSWLSNKSHETKQSNNIPTLQQQILQATYKIVSFLTSSLGSIFSSASDLFSTIASVSIHGTRLEPWGFLYWIAFNCLSNASTSAHCIFSRSSLEKKRRREPNKEKHYRGDTHEIHSGVNYSLSILFKLSSKEFTSCKPSVSINLRISTTLLFDPSILFGVPIMALCFLSLWFLICSITAFSFTASSTDIKSMSGEMYVEPRRAAKAANCSDLETAGEPPTAPRNKEEDVNAKEERKAQRKTR